MCGDDKLNLGLPRSPTSNLNIFSNSRTSFKVVPHNFDMEINLKLGLEFVPNQTSLKISCQSPSILRVKLFGICYWEWAWIVYGFVKTWGAQGPWECVKLDLRARLRNPCPK